MDALSVKMKPLKKHSKNTPKGIKVVYISTPLKVEICASKFRALVQELTGKNSDSTRLVEAHRDLRVEPEVEVIDDHQWRFEEEKLAIPSYTDSSYSNDSSSSGGSGLIFDSFDEYLAPMDGSFMSMFQPDFLYDSSDQLGLLEV